MPKKESKEKSLHKVEREFVKTQKRVKHFIISLAVFAVIVILILVAVSLTNKPCSDIEDTEKDECLHDLAVEQLEIKYCDMILIPELVEACKVDIAIGTNDAALCGDLSDLSRGRCLKNIAEGTGNPDVCSEIKNEYWHDLCFIKMSDITDDRNYCRKVLSQKQKDQCFYDFAISRNNSMSCNGISNSTIQGKCKLEIAVRTDDVSLCDQTVKLSYKGMCFQHFAFTRNDPSLCANITAGIIKTDCYDYFNLTAPEEDERPDGGLIIQY